MIGGEVVSDNLTRAHARAIAEGLEREGRSYSWEVWEGDRTGWNSVRGSKVAFSGMPDDDE